jgi:hypothetical protein
MKTWIKTEVYNHTEQIMSIEPNEGFDGIQISVGEVDGSEKYERFYINDNELPTIIQKLQEMMDYVTKKEEE